MVERAAIVSDLLLRSASESALSDPNRPILASLIAGRMIGEGALDASLGLSAEALETLWRDYFRGRRLTPLDQAVEELPERDDLIKLLLSYRANRFESELWLACIVTRACAGKRHLWRDLGLASRAELSRLLFGAFPAFAAQNSGDMRWKKFLYRLYCANEGIFVCPSPSCAECGDRGVCFAPED